MNPRENPIVRLAERRPTDLVDVILRQSRERLAEQRSPDKQTAAAKEYVRARVFLERFRLNLVMFLVSLVCSVLQAVLTCPPAGKAEWVSIVATGANISFGVGLMVIGFRRKAEAEQLVGLANRAAEARSAAVLSRAQCSESDFNA